MRKRDAAALDLRITSWADGLKVFFVGFATRLAASLGDMDPVAGWAVALLALALALALLALLRWRRRLRVRHGHALADVNAP